MIVYRTLVKNCPICDHKLDACSPLPKQEQYGPEENDVTVCIKCLSILLFNEDKSLRLASEDEISELPDEVRQAIANARDYFIETYQ